MPNIAAAKVMKKVIKVSTEKLMAMGYTQSSIHRYSLVSTYSIPCIIIFRTVNNGRIIKCSASGFSELFAPCILIQVGYQNWFVFLVSEDIRQMDSEGRKVLDKLAITAVTGFSGTR